MTGMSVPSVARRRGAFTALGEISPTLEEFRDLAVDRRFIPVTQRLLADAITPVGLYATLAADRPGTFLLESAEHGRSWSRWSFVGVEAPAALTERGGEACWLGQPPVGLPSGLGWSVSSSQAGSTATGATGATGSSRSGMSVTTTGF